jgi:hypothetical protein
MVDGDFHEIWQRITRLPDQAVVPTWSFASGYLGSEFTLEAVRPNAVTIAPPGVRSLRVSRPISKGDFANVYSAWRDYAQGRTSRGAVGRISQNTTYIFSILRHVGA